MKTSILGSVGVVLLAGWMAVGCGGVDDATTDEAVSSDEEALTVCQNPFVCAQGCQIPLSSAMIGKCCWCNGQCGKYQQTNPRFPVLRCVPN
jgi:hypothetical protein